MKHVHVLPGVEQDAAVGRGQGCVDVHVATAARDDVAVGRGDRRVDVDVAECVHRQRRRYARCGPRDRIVDEDIAIPGGRVARRGDRANRDAGRHELRRQRRARDVAARADHVILRIDQPHAGHAARCVGRHLGAVRNGDRRGGGFDEAAIAADRCARVERTGEADRAGLHVAEQENGAAAILQRARLDDAGIVDRGVEQVSGPLRGHHDLAAVRADQPAIADQRADRALVDRDVEQPVTRDVERDRLAARQHDGAEVRLDRAAVTDVRAEQRNIAVLRGDRAVVLDTRAAGPCETVLAREEISVGDVQRRGHQPADVHVRGLAEQDAVRVDQEHLPVRRQIAEDHRRIGAEHAVQRDRAAGRLVEDDALALADREGLPVDRRAVAGLRHGQRLGAGRDARLACDDFAPGRQRLCLDRARCDRARKAEPDQPREPREPGRAEQPAAPRARDGGSGAASVSDRRRDGGHVRYPRWRRMAAEFWGCQQLWRCAQKVFESWNQARPDLSGADVASSSPSLRA